VEDDEVTRMLMVRFLKRHGFEVSSAEDGLAGLKETLDWGPHLVLLDLMMPVMDGMTYLRKLQASKAAGVPVVVTSALGDQSKKTEAEVLGACEYLVKTRFTLDDLLATVRRCVGA
jgi:DNA-binding response OmpR family regulator